MLLGVVNETGVPVAGLVDAALAACSLEPAPARVLHLDLELHQAMLTVLEYVGRRSRRSEAQPLRDRAAPRRARHLQQTWMQFIAENFVRKTRFDPLHDASSEQRLVDQLPAWLAQLQESEHRQRVDAVRRAPLEIEIDRAQFIAAAEPHYAELLRLVQDARVAGMPIELRVSQRVAALPGLLERLSTLRDCGIAGAAAGRRQRSERCNMKRRFDGPRIRWRSSISCRLRAPRQVRCSRGA